MESRRRAEGGNGEEGKPVPVSEHHVLIVATDRLGGGPCCGIRIDKSDGGASQRNTPGKHNDNDVGDDGGDDGEEAARSDGDASALPKKRTAADASSDNKAEGEDEGGAVGGPSTSEGASAASSEDVVSDNREDKTGDDDKVIDGDDDGGGDVMEQEVIASDSPPDGDDDGGCNCNGEEAAGPLGRQRSPRQVASFGNGSNGTAERVPASPHEVDSVKGEDDGGGGGGADDTQQRRRRRRRRTVSSRKLADLGLTDVAVGRQRQRQMRSACLKGAIGEAGGGGDGSGRQASASHRKCDGDIGKDITIDDKGGHHREKRQAQGGDGAADDENHREVQKLGRLKPDVRRGRIEATVRYSHSNGQ